MLARIPKEARAETAEGAEAFVRFYFAQLNKAFREADPQTLSDLATTECIVCNAMLEGVKDVKAKKQRYDSDLITVDSVAVTDFVSADRKVLARVKQNPVRVLDAKGALVETAPAGTGNYLFSMAYENQWQIKRLQEAR